MEALGKIFGSISRVKIMRLFLCNEEEIFDKADISKRAKVSAQATTKELADLEKSGLIRKKSFFKQGKKLKNGKIGKKKRVQGYVINEKFKYLLPIKNLLCGAAPMKSKEIGDKFSSVGHVRAIIIAGVFIQDTNSRIDILVVGDNMNNTKLRNAVSSIESEIGRELRYAAFDTTDFKYRLGVCDRLVRDIFDYPHEIVIDRIGLE